MSNIHLTNLQPTSTSFLAGNPEALRLSPMRLLPPSLLVAAQGRGSPARDLLGRRGPPRRATLPERVQHAGDRTTGLGHAEAHERVQVRESGRREPGGKVQAHDTAPEET